MPGPGSKKSKSKTKPAIQKSEPTSKPVPYEYIGQIDNAEGWYLVIDELCKIYKVPGARLSRNQVQKLTEV